MDQPGKKAFPSVPPRLSRVFQQDAPPLYLITFVTHHRKPVLANSAVHEAFLTFCETARQRGVNIGRYVIMPDHVHLFLSHTREIRMGSWIGSLKRALGRALHGVDQPLWQRGFFDHLLRSSESYREKWTYVYQNPVRAGLVLTPEEWPYSGEIVVIHRN